MAPFSFDLVIYAVQPFGKKLIMTNFAAQLKGEISKIARKESRFEIAGMKKANSQYRTEIAALKRRISEVESMLKRLGSGKKNVTEPESADDSKPMRFRVDGFVTLRKKHALSAADMGRLIGVSAQTIYAWESGKTRPGRKQLAEIARIRKLSKKEIQSGLSAA